MNGTGVVVVVICATLAGTARAMGLDFLEYGALGLLALTIIFNHIMASRRDRQINIAQEECHKWSSARERALKDFVREQRDAMEKVIDRCPYRRRGG